MKRTSNKEQKAYMKAKAALEALETMENEMEEDFVKSLGVVNDDGSIPTRTWTIDNDEIAEKAIDDFGKLLEESGLWKKILKAREDFKVAEEALVQYALSIIPFRKERETLTKAAKTNIKYREQIIETVLKLDVSTVK